MNGVGNKGNMQRAIIILPTYNERENIARTVAALEEVFRTIKTWDMHILVVDDTSPDGTADEVRRLQKKYPYLHLLINPKKGGLGMAYLKGMAEAFDKLKAKVVFEFDADLSHDPSKIPLFLTKIDQGCDMVLGTRYSGGGSIPQDWGFSRKFLSIVGNWVIMIVFTDFRIDDWTSGYRAITQPVYEAVHRELNSQRFSGYTFQIGFLHKAVRRGFRIEMVPYHFTDRIVGSSKMSSEYAKNTLIFILKVRLQEILAHRVFRFAAVGGLGALVQLITLGFWRMVAPFELAFFLAIECAVLSNFVLNNVWTFADRKLHAGEIPGKFLQFNLSSAGSILIQMALGWAGKTFIGLFALFQVPFTKIVFDTGSLFAIVGILVGMVWNYFAYSRLVWRAAEKPENAANVDQVKASSTSGKQRT